ncbi:Endonuclease/Exonuclease/phosphatase family protein [Anaplasma phagocytophilum]|nr:Endonuclease/Exonuclease/phosphatase family protein [Anaplasma phagocytophilum]
MALNLATLNVSGLNSRKKQYQSQRLLSGANLDFLAVQETKMKSDNDIAVALKSFLFKYEVCVSHAIGFSAGCSLFLKKNPLIFRT